MDDYIDILAKSCGSVIGVPSDESACSDVNLRLSKLEAVKLQSFVLQNNPPLGEFNMNILGAGLGLVLIFYVLGYGLGRIIKMVNL